MTTRSTTAYTMPDASPLYPELPYHYTGYHKLSVFARSTPDALSVLLPAPLELVGDVFEVFVMDVPEVTGLTPYAEAGVVLQVQHADEVGGHVAFEYVSTDAAMASGREIWGYPKKMAEVELNESEYTVTASCTRRGEQLIDMSFTPADQPIEIPTLQPRFQIRRIPSPSPDQPTRGEIIWNMLNDASISSEVWGEATMSLSSVLGDELGSLNPLKIVGARLIVGNFVLGHGRVVGEV